MKATRNNTRRRALGLLAGIIVGAGILGITSPPASAATTASFSAGVVTVNGDASDNVITISRNAGGAILVNGGAVAVVGGAPTVANTALIRVFGLGGNDTISLSEVNGPLPRANLFGRTGNDVVSGGTDNDTITGGDADDQAFGQSGNDRMIWNPGDDTDLNEGGDGTDTVEVNGGNGSEAFTATANGTRVRFDRLNPAPFTI